MENKLFIDATLFLGMHYEDPVLRHRSLDVMSYAFKKKITMNLEQVGICDNIIWDYKRDIQDGYYPFMDVLHSEMNILRIPYENHDLNTAQNDSRLKIDTLNLQQKLLLAQVINANGLLFTNDSIILDAFQNSNLIGDPDELKINKAESPLFNSTLDELYRTSLCLKVTSNKIAPSRETVGEL
ncbi:DUF6190 family protein [Sessilibacter corallicola]|uniref:DUF6190 family protein n=1 Tax=Sessilibacter corallicola TaxID=2904075 RepID=A0ABQ0A9N3_9GAMM